jgi:hypothetical protein
MADAGRTFRAFLVMLCYLVISAYVLVVMRPNPKYFFAAFLGILLGGFFIRLWSEVYVRE